MIEKLSAISPMAGADLSLQDVNRAAHSDKAASADFGAMLSGMLAGSAEALKAAEAASIAGIRGEASVREVAEAVMNAEQTLQAGIALRDKIVAAYLELSRMQI